MVEADRAASLAEARLFRLLSDPTRLAVIEELSGGPRTVGQLVEALAVPRSRLSNHLACLRWCGVASAEKRGRTVLYRLLDERLLQLVLLGRSVAAPHRSHLSSCARLGPGWV